MAKQNETNWGLVPYSRRASSSSASSRDDKLAWLRTIETLLASQNALANAYWWLVYVINNGDRSVAQKMIDIGVIDRLVEIVTMSSNSELLDPALISLAKISAHNADAVVSHGGLVAFKRILSNQHLHKDWTPKEVGCALWHVVGKQHRIQAVINVGLLPCIVNLLGNGDVQVKEMAAWIVRTYAQVGSRAQVALLIAHGIVGKLVKLLATPENLPLTKIAMNTLVNVLHLSKEIGQWETTKACLDDFRFMQYVLRLKTHEDPCITETAEDLIDLYENVETIRSPNTENMAIPVASLWLYLQNFVRHFFET